MATEKKRNGRPPKYDDSKILLDSINSFFALCDERRQMPEKAGLCIYLGISRDTYSEYRKNFPDTIKYADNYIESCWVRRLNLANATGVIFYLKNAFKEDFKDRHETDITTKGDKIQGDGVLELAARAAELLKQEKV